MRTEAHTLMDEDLHGLLQGNIDAINRIRWFAQRIANYQRRFGIERVEVEDLVADSMLDIYRQAASGRCNNVTDLQEVIKRSVQRNVQRLKRQRNREGRSMDRVPFYRAAPPYGGHLTPEARVRMEDLLLKAVNVHEIYRESRDSGTAWHRDRRLDKS